jgi:isoleucyl-tRNA synthetase
LAPIVPHLAEEMYLNLSGGQNDEKESVHLCDWPKADKSLIEKKIKEQMTIARQIVESGLGQRNEKGIKVRQPLAKISVTAPNISLPKDLINIISEEVNVKTVMLKKGSTLSTKLDVKITPRLKEEGIARDFVRLIQDGRKKAGFNVEDRISTNWETDDKGLVKAIESQVKYITKETLSTEFVEGKTKTIYEENVRLDDKDIWFGITKK